MSKQFVVTIMDDGELLMYNDGCSDFEIIGAMQLIEADLRVNFASLRLKERQRLEAEMIVAEHEADMNKENEPEKES